LHVGNQWLIFSSSTDGRIAIYSIDQTLFNDNVKVINPVHHLLAHQSGVNSLSVHYNTSTNECTVASGGDDQALFVSVFKYDTTTTTTTAIQDLTTFKLPDVHTAAVNGIYTNGSILIETSIDQRLNIFQICKQQEELKLQLMQSIMIETNDVSGMSILNNDDNNSMEIAVCGAELQLLRIN
jgi:WD40 repeat protein